MTWRLQRNSLVPLHNCHHLISLCLCGSAVDILGIRVGKWLSWKTLVWTSSGGFVGCGFGECRMSFISARVFGMEGRCENDGVIMFLSSRGTPPARQTTTSCEGYLDPMIHCSRCD